MLPLSTPLTRGAFLRRLAVAGLAVGLGVDGLAGGLAGRVAPVSAAPARDDDLAPIRAGIQATLDRYAEAFSTGDDALLKQVVDERSAALRRIITEQFTNDRRRRGMASYAVERVRPALNGYYKADISARTRSGGQVTGTYVFREVDGRWLLTEPIEKDLGERRLRQTDHFRVRYFEWDEDQIDRVAELLERARAHDIARIGFEDSEQIFVTVSPTFQVNPSLSNRAGAYYSNGTLHVRSPESFAFGLHAPGAAEQVFLIYVEHEYGHHLVRTRTRGKALKHWMDEGMAEWVTGNFSRGAIRAGFDADVIPADLLDWADQRLYNEQAQPPDQVGMAYALSANAVRYIVEQRGGLDQFWALVEHYVTTRDFPQSVQDVFGQSWSDFQAAYRAWVQE